MVVDRGQLLQSKGALGGPSSPYRLEEATTEDCSGRRDSGWADPTHFRRALGRDPGGGTKAVTCCQLTDITGDRAAICETETGGAGWRSGAPTAATACKRRSGAPTVANSSASGDRGRRLDIPTALKWRSRSAAWPPFVRHPKEVINAGLSRLRECGERLQNGDRGR